MSKKTARERVAASSPVSSSSKSEVLRKSKLSRALSTVKLRLDERLLWAGTRHWGETTTFIQDWDHLYQGACSHTFQFAAFQLFSTESSCAWQDALQTWCSKLKNTFNKPRGDWFPCCKQNLVLTRLAYSHQSLRDAYAIRWNVCMTAEARDYSL